MISIGSELKKSKRSSPSLLFGRTFDEKYFLRQISALFADKFPRADRDDVFFEIELLNEVEKHLDDEKFERSFVSRFPTLNNFQRVFEEVWIEFFFDGRRSIVERGNLDGVKEKSSIDRFSRRFELVREDKERLPVRFAGKNE